MTDYHDYNEPEQGAERWHVPLNENFREIDADIEIRDTEANRSDYEPKDGAKYFETDTGDIYLGDGTDWNRQSIASGAETSVSDDGNEVVRDVTDIDLTDGYFDVDNPGGAEVDVSVTDDAIDTDAIDESIKPTWTGRHTFENGLTENGVKLSTKAEKTFYVDQANGDDSNDGTSASSAFASYPRALEEAPRFADKQVTIRQIGDYTTPTATPLKITNKGGGIFQDGTFGLTIVGDSETPAADSNAPSSQETFDGNIHVEGCKGIRIQNLNWDGMPWVMSSTGVAVFNCYIEGFSYAFAYLRYGEVNMLYNVYDGQANDPNNGFVCLRNGRMQVEGGEIRNWDYENNTAYNAFNGGKIIDGFDDTYPNADRSGDIVPTDGRGISDEAFDRDLDGKDLMDGGSTVYDGSNGYVTQSSLENDTVTVAGNAVSLGDATAVDHGDMYNIGTDDHHARDHAGRHGFGDNDELATALRYEPQSEPSTPSSGVVRWYDQNEDAFKAKFDDGTSVTLAQK